MKRTSDPAPAAPPAVLRLSPGQLARRYPRRPARGAVPAWLTVTPWLDHLRRHLLVAREGTNPEGVHQMRVACGRLLVWLQLGGRSVLRDDLHWLRRGAGEVRDLDVLLLSSPPAPFARWLRERLAEKREALRAQLDDARLPALLEALEHLPPLRVEDADVAARRLRRRARARGSKLPTVRNAAALHALRRALRRLRFAEEWRGKEQPKRLKRLQQTLGEMNDGAVALRIFDAFPERGGLRTYRAGLVARVARARGEALRLWADGGAALEG